MHQSRQLSRTLWVLIAVAIISLSGRPWASGEDLRRFLPTVKDQRVADVFTNPATYWYTEADMPPAYQSDSTLRGAASFHDPLYDMSGGADQKRGNGNGNREFPWRTPGGTDQAEIESVRAMLLPAVNGRTLPVVAYFETVPYPRPVMRTRRLAWRFPTGTVFIEVLFMRDERGRPWAFTVRLRERRERYWDVAVFRPVQTRDDLADEFAFKPSPLKRARIVAAHPRGPAFDETAVWDILPRMNPDDVRRLLSRPFEDCTGVDWSEAIEPASVQRFSLVPAGYQGALAGNEPDRCMNCHEHVGKQVAAFDPARDWYGFIRGSDGIFSFQPVDPSSVSRRGNPLPIRLRSDLLRAGLITMDPAAPGTKYYQPLEGNP